MTRCDDCLHLVQTKAGPRCLAMMDGCLVLRDIAVCYNERIKEGNQMLTSRKDKKGTSLGGNRIEVYTDGKVHATIYTITQTAVGDAWVKGDALDGFLQQIQDQGGDIISVMPYALGDGKTARCVITYRAPLITVTGGNE